MAELEREGVRAGALEISTTRLLAHRTSKRADDPGTLADARELAALGGVLRELGTGVCEIVPRGMAGEISPEAHAELDMMGELARTIGRPVTFSMVQTHTEVDRYRRRAVAAERRRTHPCDELDDAKEGPRAFVERRPPEWSGRQYGESPPPSIDRPTTSVSGVASLRRPVQSLPCYRRLRGECSLDPRVDCGSDTRHVGVLRLGEE
jgi:hypothetical protein